MTRLALVVILATAAVGACLPDVAAAETVIPEGQRVHEVDVFGDDVIVNGTSEGAIVVVAGDVTLGPHAHAGDGITVIGGTLHQAPGAIVRGDVLQVGSSLPEITSGMVAAALAALLALRLLVIWFVWRAADAIQASPSVERMCAGARSRPLRAGLVGALIVAGAVAGAGLMLLTVVGALFGLAVLGILLVCAVLGCAFALRAVPDGRPLLIALAVPLLGDALLALATIAGAGALAHHLVRERPPTTVPTT